jgi:hypothetical protein
MRKHLSRLGLSAVVTALLVTAMPAPLAAQSTGPGADGSLPSETAPFPGPSGVSITTSVIVIPGQVLPNQGDIPADEQLSSPDTIIFTANASGSGGGATSTGDACTPSSAAISLPLQLPGLALQMDPPAGLGGVVTVPTYFSAAFLGEPRPSASESHDYTTCDSHFDTILQRTVWSARTETLSMHVSSAPIRYTWKFGDSDVSDNCPDRSKIDTRTDASGMGGDPKTPVHHVYCISSKRTTHTDGYAAFMQVDFQTNSVLNDRPWVSMTTLSRNYRRYPVREVQAVLDE